MRARSPHGTVGGSWNSIDDLGLCDDVRSHCHAVMRTARWVQIDSDALARIKPGDPPRLDPAVHLTDGTPATVATYVLALDAVNFGSGWFDELGDGFSYETVAAALKRVFEAGPVELCGYDRTAVASVFGLPLDHALTAHFASALNELGDLLSSVRVLDLIAGDSCEEVAGRLADALPRWDDVGFYKRAQLVTSDLVLAGVADYVDLERLTIFADNLVPHVLRLDGVIRVHPSLARQLNDGQLIEAGSTAERELRAASVVACEQLADLLGVTERDLDGMLWQRGQDERYRDPPAHRCQTIFY